MLDFGILPPEINSARMYSGPGSGPMMAAASGWDALATQLESFAVGYSSALSELQGESWSGSASAAMAAAATPYVTWATATAGQAEQAANQARTAAAAYEVAFAATVPPAAVAANRVQLATLVATNFFGQNTMAIAATEAAYAEMWAQDAAAMYGYAASSAPAATLTPFNEPPRTTSTAGQSAQTTAVAHAVSSTADSQLNVFPAMSTLPQQLQALSTAGPSGTSPSESSPILTAISHFSTFGHAERFFTDVFQTTELVADFVNEANLVGFQQHFGLDATPPTPVATTGAMTAGTAQRAVLASVGHAAPIGKLSVPQSWSAVTSVSSPASVPLQLTGTDLRGLPASQTSTTPLGPLGGMPARPVGNTGRRIKVRRFRMPRPAAGG